MSKPGRIVEAERKCLVCEWTGLVQEPEETPQIGMPCVSCRAPTERLAIRRWLLRPANIHAAALSRLGAAKGGRARAQALAPRRRQEIARAAALARWNRR
jgi:hypothetical protein